MVGTSYQEYKKESVSASGSGRASELTTELDNATKATDVGGNSLALGVDVVHGTFTLFV